MVHTATIFKNKYFMVGDERFFFVTILQKKFAVPDKCPHRGGPLSLGTFCEKENTIQCPWHDNFFKVSALIKKEIPAVRIGSKILYI
jgi:nitrite reductase/ring-hydroxylating ferredoxin subunit